MVASTDILQDSMLHSAKNKMRSQSSNKMFNNRNKNQVNATVNNSNLSLNQNMFATSGASPVKTKGKQEQLASNKVQLHNGQLHIKNGLNLIAEPNMCVTPISLMALKQPTNNRRYFSALSAADTFNSFTNSNKQSQA